MKTSKFWVGLTCMVLFLIVNQSFGQEVEVIGNLKVVDGTEGDGKILTSDATGQASWQDEVKQQLCVSIEGDTLYLSGGGWVVIPGVSMAQWPVDGDGNVIRPTLIGDQYWMSENLKSTSYADGTPITKFTNLIDWTATTPGYGFKFNNEPLAETYGYHYNQYIVADTNSHQICPLGWRLPSVADLQELIDFVGADSVGHKLKSDTTAHWSINGGALTGPGSNEYFFNGKGAGTIHYPSQGNSTGVSFYFFTTDYNATNDRWSMGKLYINNPFLQIVEESWNNLGGSIRCMRDKPK